MEAFELATLQSAYWFKHQHLLGSASVAHLFHTTPAGPYWALSSTVVRTGIVGMVGVGEVLRWQWH
jgi:hypothetical protein